MPIPQIAQPMRTLPVCAPEAAISPAVVKIPPPMVEPMIMAVSLEKDKVLLSTVLPAAALSTAGLFLFDRLDSLGLFDLFEFFI